MEKFVKYIAPLFFAFSAGIFFECFMQTGKPHRLASFILFLLMTVMTMPSYPQKKKEEHTFEVEKETPPLTQTIPSGSNTVTNTEE